MANSLVFADRWLHENGGPPNASIGTTMYGLYSRDTAPFGPALPPNATPIGRVRNRVMNAVHRRIVFGPVNRHLDDVRERVGLPRRGQPVLDSFLSEYLYLQDCAESFEYPRSDLPPQVHFTGPLLPEPRADAARPAWWPELSDGRPVVLVTQGTVRNEDDLLFAPVMAGLAAEDVLVIVTTGGGVLLDGPVPSNVRVEPFVPYAALMPHVSAYVTNGGYGGVQMALAHGVPILVSGATEDKPEVGARVAWSGAGIRLRDRQPQPAAIKDAVRRLLTDDTYRMNARRIAADIATYDSAGIASELVERLARTGRPVLRTELGAHEPAVVAAARPRATTPGRSSPRWAGALPRRAPAPPAVGRHAVRPAPARRAARWTARRRLGPGRTGPGHPCTSSRVGSSCTSWCRRRCRGRAHGPPRRPA